MPYLSDADLPPSIRSHLPPHAREIFRNAFNQAWQTYRQSTRVEEIAHRIAWTAVKRRYCKSGARWVPRDHIEDHRW
jgi:cation transport regulator